MTSRPRVKNGDIQALRSTGTVVRTVTRLVASVITVGVIVTA
jgi:hypothetical protein